MHRYVKTGRRKPPGFDVLWHAGWMDNRGGGTMIAVCPKCGMMHETTTEDAYSPTELDRMCVRCYRATLDEAAATCAEMRADRAGAALILANAPRYWEEVDAYERIRIALLGAK